MNAASTPDEPKLLVPLRDLGELLVKHLNLHEGLYQVGIGFRLGVGAIPGEPNQPTVPAAMVGVESVILSPVPPDFNGPNTIDASAVNPAKTKKVRAKKS